MRNIIYLLITLLLPSISSAQYFKNLSMEDGLSQPSVLSIHQDTLGRMWFGTREGLNVYDGKKVVSLKPQDINDYRNNHFLIGNQVGSIVSGKDGNLFMEVGKRVYKYDLYKEVFHQIHGNSVSTLNNSIDKNIWFVSNDSLYYYDVATDCNEFVWKTKIYKPTALLHTNDSILYLGGSTGLYEMNLKTKKNRVIIPDISVFCIFKSSRNEYWISTREDGLYSIKRDGSIVHAPISPNHVVSNQIREIIEDSEQNIWFGTFDGLQVYNPYKDTYKVYRASNRIGTLSHTSVFSLYRDKQGTIWVGSYYGGVDYFHERRYIYKNYVCNVLSDDCLNFPLVGNMIEDRDHNIWIATDGGGINCLNSKTQKFTYVMSGKGSILHNNVKTISYDRKRDHIYVGTHTGGLSRLDRKTGKIHNYLLDKGKDGPNEIIFHSEFHKDALYVSARNGLWKLNPDTEKFELIIKGRYYVNFKIDNRDYIWLNTKFDITLLNLNNPEDKKVLDMGKTLPYNVDISNIAYTSDNKIYVTTSGYGFYSYDIDTKELVHFTKENDNLLSNYCYSAIETSNNNIIITTDKGLSIYSPFTLDIYSAEISGHQGISNITNGCGVFVASDELIYVGGIDGMISFYEKDLLYNYNSLPKSNFYFSNLKVNNMDVIPHDETGILDKTLPFMDKIVLSPSQNNIIVDYSNSNFVGYVNNAWYQYRLEGFDNKWVSTMQTSLHYTNLPPGNYVLTVRQKGNLVNMFEGQEISLAIKVLAPWYKTFFAYVMYILIFAYLVYAVWRFKMSRKLMAISLENEKKEKNRIEELNKMKLRFFTNISHEFRTPLTLITGQIEVLSQDRDLSLSVKRKIHRIYKNTIHMRNLINELLDFRKQEQGFFKLKVEEVDIVAFLSELFSTFKDYAAKRNIRYELKCPEEKVINMWFDTIQMKKAIFNLLSNAFKYTGEKGMIVLRLHEVEDGVQIEVEDTGCGISEIDLKNIFDRFYQAGDENSRLSSGTGIGLALTKGIIELHKGTIEVESTLGKGSIFRIRLLAGNSQFSKEQLSGSGAATDYKYNIDDSILELKLNMEDAADSETYDANEDLQTGDKVKPIMLVVEDDNDIIELLDEVFSPMYSVYKAHNGQEGYDMARELQPDIIVSDVMMPVMSGKEMCSRIKNCIEISHIPVVLLTAQDAEEQYLEGFALGADDYITKPFNVKLLVARCNNLVNNRKSIIHNLKDSNNNNVELVNTSAMALNAVDQKLIDQATEVIRLNFDNPDFNMDMLASELNMGRSKLYARFKEITNLTPNEYTLRLKLEEGKQLLLNSPELNISEISYKLGFSSLRYFSKCFKSFCGVTPQNFRKNSNS